MYRSAHDPRQLELDLFFMPFGGYLDPENRWVKLARRVPWQQYERQYAEHFSKHTGPPAKPFRIALGALLIQKQLATSDRETVELIRENPYLQFFIGLGGFTTKAPFGASTMKQFRKRIPNDVLGEISAYVREAEQAEKQRETGSSDS